MSQTEETPVDRHISIYEKFSEKYYGQISVNEIALQDLLGLMIASEYKVGYLHL